MCTGVFLVLFSKLWTVEMAGMLSKLWDDVAGGSTPDKGMKQLRKSSSANNANFPAGMESVGAWFLRFLLAAMECRKFAL